MTYKLKDGRYSDSKHVYLEDCEIGICYWTDDQYEWYFSPKYAEDFFSSDQLFEIANMLKQLNDKFYNPFIKENNNGLPATP